jgi:hypothetical protein
MSAISSTFSPVTVPSFLAASVMSWTWPRPWCAMRMLSERVSVHFTGRPSLRATSSVRSSSGNTVSLPPKPPPTSGAITRSLCSGRPRVSAVMVLRMCGTWVDDHMVSCSPLGSTTTERGSMNAGTSRCWMNRRRSTTESGSASAAATASSVDPPVPASAESNTHSALRLVPSSGCTRGAPSARAASTSSTGGSGS